METLSIPWGYPLACRACGNRHPNWIFHLSADSIRVYPQNEPIPRWLAELTPCTREITNIHNILWQIGFTQPEDTQYKALRLIIERMLRDPNEPWIYHHDGIQSHQPFSLVTVALLKYTTCIARQLPNLTKPQQRDAFNTNWRILQTICEGGWGKEIATNSLIIQILFCIAIRKPTPQSTDPYRARCIQHVGVEQWNAWIDAAEHEAQKLCIHPTSSLFIRRVRRNIHHLRIPHPEHGVSFFTMEPLVFRFEEQCALVGTHTVTVTVRRFTPKESTITVDHPTLGAFQNLTQCTPLHPPSEYYSRVKQELFFLPVDASLMQRIIGLEDRYIGDEWLQPLLQRTPYDAIINALPRPLTERGITDLALSYHYLKPPPPLDTTLANEVEHLLRTNPTRHFWIQAAFAINRQLGIRVLTFLYKRDATAINLYLKFAQPTLWLTPEEIATITHNKEIQP